MSHRPRTRAGLQRAREEAATRRAEQVRPIPAGQIPQLDAWRADVKRIAAEMDAQHAEKLAKALEERKP